MEKELHSQRSKESSSALSAAFLKMKDFFDTFSFETNDDVLIFFQTFFSFYEEVTEYLFSEAQENFSSDIVQVFSEKESSDEDTLDEDKVTSYQSSLEGELMKFLSQELYCFDSGHAHWYIDSCKDFFSEPLKKEDVFFSKGGGSLFPLSQLEESSGSISIDPVLKETLRKFLQKFLWIVDRSQRKERQAQLALALQERENRQKMLEEKTFSLFENLQQDSEISKFASLATLQDFEESDFYSLQTIFPELYAEKPEYFNNIFLGFDLSTGKFETREEKTKKYIEYFHYYPDPEKGDVLEVAPQRLQEKKLFDSSQHLPILSSQISNSLVALFQSHVEMQAQTDEQKIDLWLKDCYYSEQDKQKLKKRELLKFKQVQPQTYEEKRTLFWKVSSLFDAWRKHSFYQKLSFSAPLSNEVSDYLAEKIPSCTTVFTDYGDGEKKMKLEREKFSDEQKQFFIDEQERIALEEKLLGWEIFGQDFDFEKLRNEQEFRSSLKFYYRLAEFKGAYRMVLSEYYGGNKRIGEFVDRHFESQEEYRKFEDQFSKIFIMMNDIQRGNDTEKEIQNLFDEKFVFTEELLHSVLVSLLDKYLLELKRYDREHGLRKLQHTSQVFGALAKQRSFSSDFLGKVYEEIFLSIDDYYSFEPLLKLSRGLSEKPHFDKVHLQHILQEEYDSVQYRSGGFSIRRVNDLEEIKKIAFEHEIYLRLPKLPPLEAYYLFRLRTPERVLKKQMRENFYDRYEGTIGYQKGDLASLENMEELLQDIGSPFKWSDAMEINMREYFDIPEERWFDRKVIVPVAVNFPKVEVSLHGNWDEKGGMMGHYVLVYDEERQLFSLIFDDSLKDSGMLVGKHNLENYLILGGGFLSFNTDFKTLEVGDRMEGYQHEPRILTLTALKNALKGEFPDWKFFIGDDAWDNLYDHWG